jgi:hypothetical protein
MRLIKGYLEQTTMLPGREMAKSCPKKRSLLLLWQAATEAYSESVTELAKKAGEISADEYEMLRKQIERARFHTADARNAFELHAEEHGC